MEKIKLAIVGSRDALTIVKDKHNKKIVPIFVRDFLPDLLTEHKERIATVISGGARGVDKIAQDISNSLNIPIKVIRPDNPNSKQSYILRNFKIVDEADEIYALWDGESRGTKSVIDYASRKSKKINIILCRNKEEC